MKIAIPAEYGVNTLEELVQTTQPPFTPEQRTKLVRDILNHEQELDMGRKDSMGHKKWQHYRGRVSRLSDEGLVAEAEMCDEWILSRRDIPLIDEDPIAQAIESHMRQLPEGQTLIPSHPTLIHQRYKRFADDQTADYGFVCTSECQHVSDR